MVPIRDLTSRGKNNEYTIRIYEKHFGAIDADSVTIKLKNL